MGGLDETDVKILRLLQEDASRPKRSIGAEIPLSDAAVGRRIKGLRKKGYVVTYRACLDLKKLGYGTTVMVLVKLRNHGKDALERFESAFESGFPNVVEICRIMGSWDYVLKVVARDDHHYDEIFKELVGHDEVENVNSHLILSESTRALPLPSATPLGGEVC